MRYILGILAFWPALTCLVFLGTPPGRSPARLDIVTAPGDGPADAVIEVIGQARTVVTVMAYELTDDAIAEALLAARGRGVEVRAVLDDGQLRSRASDWRRLAEAGCRVSFDGRHPIMHTKLVVADDRVATLGSANQSAQARRNAEVLAVTRDRGAIRDLLRHYAEHAGHSEPAEVDLGPEAPAVEREPAPSVRFAPAGRPGR